MNMEQMESKLYLNINKIISDKVQAFNNKWINESFKLCLKNTYTNEALDLTIKNDNLINTIGYKLNTTLAYNELKSMINCEENIRKIVYFIMKTYGYSVYKEFTKHLVRTLKKVTGISFDTKYLCYPAQKGCIVPTLEEQIKTHLNGKISVDAYLLILSIGYRNLLSEYLNDFNIGEFEDAIIYTENVDILFNSITDQSVMNIYNDNINDLQFNKNYLNDLITTNTNIPCVEIANYIHDIIYYNSSDRYILNTECLKIIEKGENIDISLSTHIYLSQILSLVSDDNINCIDTLKVLLNLQKIRQPYKGFSLIRSELSISDLENILNDEKMNIYQKLYAIFFSKRIIYEFSLLKAGDNL